MYVLLLCAWYTGGGAGGAPATARAASPGGCGAAVRGEHAPLLQPGAAGREAVAVQRSLAGAGRLRTQPTAAVAGAFESGDENNAFFSNGS